MLLLQGHVAKLYYFVTSEVNFAVFLVQFILSLFPDKQSAYQYTEEDDVSEFLLSLIIDKLYLTES